MQQHEIQIRVRYCETDAMGFLHHSNFLNYFEIGRTELFRQAGGDYRAMEENGLFFVVVRIDVRYKRPARYDDQLTLRTTITRITPAKIQHTYHLFRGDELLTEGQSTLACIDANGQIQRIPDYVLDRSGQDS
jgi:acyl-CoA thioester hydrolase